MDNAHEKHETVSKKVFKRYSTNKINLEGKRKINIEFKRLDKIN